MSPRITVNAGLRWEPTLPNTDKYGRGTYFDFGAFAAGQTSSVYENAPPGLFFVGDSGFSRSLWDRHLANFAPRLGLVWNPHGDGRDTFRIGGAILFDTTEIFFDERKTTNPPYGGSIDIPTPAGGFTDPYLNYPGGSPFPPGANVTFPRAGVYINMPRTTRPTYLAQWNVSYQRQFARNWLASITYLGNKTTHLWVGSEVNPAVFGPGATTSNTNQRRMLYRQNPVAGAYYASINQADEGSNAHYNARSIQSVGRPGSLQLRLPAHLQPVSGGQQFGEGQPVGEPAPEQLAVGADPSRHERPGSERDERQGQFPDRNE